SGPAEPSGVPALPPAPPLPPPAPPLPPDPPLASGSAADGSSAQPSNASATTRLRRKEHILDPAAGPSVATRSARVWRVGGAAGARARAIRLRCQRGRARLQHFDEVPQHALRIAIVEIDLHDVAVMQPVLGGAVLRPVEIRTERIHEEEVGGVA